MGWCSSPFRMRHVENWAHCQKFFKTHSPLFFPPLPPLSPFFSLSLSPLLFPMTALRHFEIQLCSLSLTQIPPASAPLKSLPFAKERLCSSLVHPSLRPLQDAAAAHVAGSSGEEQSIRQRTLVLDSSIRPPPPGHSIGSQASSGLLDSKLADRPEEELQRARCIMADGDASSFLPSKSQGGFVRMFLGPINVRARKEAQLTVKEEYNSCRGFEAYAGFLLLQTALVEIIKNELGR